MSNDTKFLLTVLAIIGAMFLLLYAITCLVK